VGDFGMPKARPALVGCSGAEIKPLGGRRIVRIARPRSGDLDRCVRSDGIASAPHPPLAAPHPPPPRQTLARRHSRAQT
jgi:hypothetical protein